LLRLIQLWLKLTTLARKLSVKEPRLKRLARTEHDRLVEEAANLYGQASETLAQASEKADQMAKQKNPGWYGEYFSL
jgi:hypothetical protein